MADEQHCAVFCADTIRPTPKTARTQKLAVRKRQTLTADDAGDEIYRIVLTGGPCAGKTSGMVGLACHFPHPTGACDRGPPPDPPPADANADAHMHAHAAGD